MTREEVASATKIPATLISALEGGQVERLPGRVFVLNYIRAYAKVIGLAPDEAVLRYEEVSSNGQPGSAASEPLKPGRMKKGLGIGPWVIAVLLLLGAVGIWMVITGHTPWHLGTRAGGTP